MSISTVTSKLGNVGKVIVAAIGLAATALVTYTEFIPSQYQGYVTAFIALATLVGAYHAPYGPVGAKSVAASKLDTRKAA